MTGPVFTEMAIKLAIFMKDVIAGQLLLHVRLPSPRPGLV